jgi:predicted outer membrane repeat protein
MALKHWLRRFARRLSGRGSSPSIRRDRRPSSRLSFERLEDRVLLATLTVNSHLENRTADSFLTLREALDVVRDGNPDDGVTGLAGPGTRMLTAGERAQINFTSPMGIDDTVRFAESTNGMTFAFGGAQLITRSVTLIGNGSANTILDVNTNDRLFGITSGAVNVTFDGLTFRDGFAGDGAAIHSEHTGTLLLRNSLFTNNAAIYDGGAIYSAQGVVNSERCVFLSNRAGLDGGALYTRTGNTAHIGSTFTDNRAASDGGAIYSSAGDISAADSTFYMNRAADDGGAIAGQGSWIRLAVIGSSFINNEAVDVGGAIGVARCSLLVAECLLADNKAGWDGGAIYVQEFRPLATGGMSVIGLSTLSGNESGRNGGGVGTSEGALQIVNSTFSDNKAPQGRGGGVYSDNAELFISHATITMNRAAIGGGIGFDVDGEGEDLALANSIVAGNLATTNPDLTAPIYFGGATVTNSLIGRNNGTELAATGTNSTSAQGNYVGGGTPGTAIAPGLGSLANNGGRMPTHALLPGSLAIDRALGNSTTPRVSDQRGLPYLGVYGASPDMGSFEFQPLVSHVNNVATFAGTAATERFVIDVATGDVTVNGFAYDLPTQGAIVIDAAAGLDRLTVLGTAGAETARMLPGQFLLDSSAGGLTASTNGFESITLEGRGGADVVQFFDSPGDDVFSGRATTSRMFGIGFDNQFFGSATVEAHAMAGGKDRANLFDTAGNNTFVARPTSAGFSETGITARAFEKVVAFASTGTDTAKLIGSARADVLSGQKGLTFLRGGGFFNQANGFDRVIVTPGAGADIANLFGTNTIDNLSAGPASSVLSGNGYRIDANGFDRVVTYAAGAGDTATLFDSAGPDRFTGVRNLAQIVGPASIWRAIGFASVTINGTAGGFNRSSLTDPLYFTFRQVGTWA